MQVQSHTALKRYSIIAGQVVFWIMPIARLCMCGLVYFWVFAAYPKDTDDARLAQIFLSAWVGWSLITAGAAFVGEPFRIRTSRFVVGTDALLAIISIAVMSGESGATIAFAICVIIFGLNLRVGRKQVVMLLTIWPLAFILRDIAVLAFGNIFRRSEFDSVQPEFITAALQIIAVASLIAWANRRYKLEKFTNDFSSLRMLSLKRSFDFDLQSWVDQMAQLFSPARAACLMTSPSKNAPSRYYHYNLDTWLNDAQRSELIRSFSKLPDGCSLIDCDNSRINTPQARSWRSLNEDEQRLAIILRREHISIALVQPMLIDRARGGVICAVGQPVDAAKIAEALYLGKHVSEMSDLLSRIGAAERAFIADAHDIARRDLHDGVLQSLAALKMRLLMVAKRKDVAKTPVDLEIRKSVDILTLEQSRLRGFLNNNEKCSRTVNLVSQLDSCIRSISLQWGVDIVLTSVEPAIDVDAESAFNIEHLLREVVANAVRHAKSKCLTVSLALKQDALMMAISDESSLSDGEQGTGKPALTLKSASLRDRLRLVNGEAYAEGLGKGTLLSTRIPMQQVDDA